MAAKGKNLRLPGMESTRLDEMHNKAIELEAVRRNRMELTRQETALADELIALGDKYHKRENGYHCEGVDVEFEYPELPKPKVKVRVQKAEAQAEIPAEAKPEEAAQQEAPPADPDQINAELDAESKKNVENVKKYWDKKKRAEKGNGQQPGAVQ